jgi:hypothetical protein
MSLVQVQCSICLEYMKKDLYLCSKCKNSFHNKCISKLLNYNNTKKLPNYCPLCRYDMEISSKTPLILTYEGETANQESSNCEHFLCKLFLCCCCIFR